MNMNYLIWRQWEDISLEDSKVGMVATELVFSLTPSHLEEAEAIAVLAHICFMISIQVTLNVPHEIQGFNHDILLLSLVAAIYYWPKCCCLV